MRQEENLEEDIGKDMGDAAKGKGAWCFILTHLITDALFVDAKQTRASALYYLASQKLFAVLLGCCARLRLALEEARCYALRFARA